MALAGTAAEANLAPRHERALDDALAALRPHSDHPAIAGLIGKLEGVAGARETAESQVEKALREVRASRVALAKSESAGSLAGLDASARLLLAEQSLAAEHLSRQPGAWSERSARERIEAIRKAEGGRAA